MTLYKTSRGPFKRGRNPDLWFNTHSTTYTVSKTPTMDEEYDVIVLGTGLTECILSGLLSVEGGLISGLGGLRAFMILIIPDLRQEGPPHGQK